MISTKRIKLRRRLRSARNSRNSIQSLPVSECYALAYYMYGIFIDYEDSDLPSDYIDTFFKLVKKANLQTGGVWIARSPEVRMAESR